MPLVVWCTSAQATPWPGIAKRHDVAKADLARQNHLDEEAELRIGQRLLLPGFEEAKVSAAAEQRWGPPKRPGFVIFHRLATHVTRKLQLLDRRGRRAPIPCCVSSALLMRPRDMRKIKVPHVRLARLLGTRLGSLRRPAAPHRQRLSQAGRLHARHQPARGGARARLSDHRRSARGLARLLREARPRRRWLLPAQQLRAPRRAPHRGALDRPVGAGRGAADRQGWGCGPQLRDRSRRAGRTRRSPGAGRAEAARRRSAAARRRRATEAGAQDGWREIGQRTIRKAMVKAVHASESDGAAVLSRFGAADETGAVSSVPLNALVEGWHAYGGNRVARFHTAMTEARETIDAVGCVGGLRVLAIG